jgi:tetratricopeptide (TPR) repeat protein
MFIIQTWKSDPTASIKEYEKAFEMDPSANSYWYNQLAQIYKSLAADDPDYKTKAIDMFTFLSEREPDNSVWNTELESLVENIDELIDLAKRSWDFNKDDLAKAWKYASLCLKVNEFQRALEPLEFLVEKSPETVNYWNQLASAYHKLDMLDKAADGYRKLIELDPKAKEHYLNLGLVYKEKNQLATARTQFLKANEVAGGWGLAIFYEGLLYEQAARSCGFDFMDKCVYQLAVDTYRRAAGMDPALSQARDRVSALSSSVPTQEDYFLRNYRKGQTITITGNCYGWIGKSITVP